MLNGWAEKKEKKKRIYQIRLKKWAIAGIEYLCSEG